MAVLTRRRAAFAVIAALASSFLGADEAAPREYALKAAFLYNFLRFVEWPEGVRGTPTVCVVEAGDAAAGVRRALKGKQLDGREVEVRAFSPAVLDGCSIVFLPEAARDSWPSIRDRLACRPILSVGESPEFLESGGSVALFADANRLRFDVNRPSCSGLRFSSRMLSLARSVDGRRAER